MWRVRGHSEDAGLLAALAARGIVLVPGGESCDAELLPGALESNRAVPRLALVSGGDPAVAAMLDAGADDAIAENAAPALIAARLAALIRRRPEALRVGELRVDRVERQAFRAGRALALLPREFALLLHLAERAGTTVSRPALLEAVWGLHFDPGTNVVAVHVSRLRARLDRGQPAPMLETVPGQGYRLVAAGWQA